MINHWVVSFSPEFLPIYDSWDDLTIAGGRLPALTRRAVLIFSQVAWRLYSIFMVKSSIIDGCNLYYSAWSYYYHRAQRWCMISNILQTRYSFDILQTMMRMILVETFCTVCESVAVSANWTWSYDSMPKRHTPRTAAASKFERHV